MRSELNVYFGVVFIVHVSVSKLSAPYHLQSGSSYLQSKLLSGEISVFIHCNHVRACCSIVSIDKLQVFEKNGLTSKLLLLRCILLVELTFELLPILRNKLKKRKHVKDENREVTACNDLFSSPPPLLQNASLLIGVVCYVIHYETSPFCLRF